MCRTWQDRRGLGKPDNFVLFFMFFICEGTPLAALPKVLFNTQTAAMDLQVWYIFLG